MADASAVGDVGDELDAPIDVGAEGGGEASFGGEWGDAGFEVAQGAGVDAEEKEVDRADGDETGDGPLAEVRTAQNYKPENGADGSEARNEQTDPGGVHRNAEVFGEHGDGEEGHEVELDRHSEATPPVGVAEIADELDENADDAERERHPGEGGIAVAVDHD